MSKLLGFFIIAPVAAIVLVAEPLQFVAGDFPPFCASEAAVTVLSGEGYLHYLAVGSATKFFSLLAASSWFSDVRTK